MSDWREDLAYHLSAHPVFCGLDEDARRSLTRVARLHVPRRGRRVWSMAKRPDELGVVLAGTMEISRGRRRDTRMVFRVLEPGDVVGLSVIAGQPHTADVRAGSGLRLASIPGRSVRRILSERPELALRIIAELGDLVGRLTDENAALRTQDLRTRVERWIRRQGGPDTEVRITHEALAAEVAASRARVSEVLGALQREGVVRLGRARLWVSGSP